MKKIAAVLFAIALIFAMLPVVSAQEMEHSNQDRGYFKSVFFNGNLVSGGVHIIKEFDSAFKPDRQWDSKQILKMYKAKKVAAFIDTG